MVGATGSESAATRRSPAGSGLAPPGARGPTDEFGGEDHAPGRAICPFDGLDQEPGHLLAHLLDRLADAGEGRARAGRDRRVVEADDGDVFGHAATRGRQHGQRARRHQIRGDEHGVDVGAPGEQALHGLRAAVLGEVRDHFERRVGREARVEQGVAVSGEPVEEPGAMSDGPATVAMTRRPWPTRWATALLAPPRLSTST